MRLFSRWMGLALATWMGCSLLDPAGAAEAVARKKPAQAPAKATTRAASKPPAKAPAKAAAKPTGKTGSIQGISRDPYVGAILLDAATGRVLMADGADAAAYPASVLKLMDLLIILEKVEQRQISLEDPVVVSARAARTGGSQVWLKEKEVFTVEDLLYALMIRSANDAAVALAEKVAGSCEAFVESMNQRAGLLGMNRTRFHSVHGLPPGPGQEPDVTTARDFSILCRELLRHPEALRYTSTRERPFRPNGGPGMVLMQTHNHLLAQVPGCDGLKTGYFAKAGFSIAVTASRNGQRVIVVMLGSVDRKKRDAKAAEWVAKGFTLLGSGPKAAAPAGASSPAH